jgi:hypothetical protein
MYTKNINLKKKRYNSMEVNGFNSEATDKKLIDLEKEMKKLKKKSKKGKVLKNSITSKKREYLRAIFKNDDKYMNQDMENIYNTLKRNRNSLNSNWTLSIYDDRESRILDLQRNLAS